MKFIEIYRKNLWYSYKYTGFKAKIIDRDGNTLQKVTGNSFISNNTFKFVFHLCPELSYFVNLVVIYPL